MEGFDKIMSKYEKRFGDIFPTMCFQDASKDELKKMALQCIDKNTPAEELFDLDYENNVY